MGESRRDRDDRGIRPGLQVLGEGGDQAHGPEHVGGDDALGGFEEVGRRDILGHHDAGHRDEHVQVGVGGEHRIAGAQHRGGVADVDRYGAEAVLGSEAIEHFGGGTRSHGASRTTRS
ncbi:hypothetical protein ASG80_12450 [Agromyces sp. Soil535]|nr:hypothetical protein ASG80_12450 [Agromyces sp. Soil535]